MPAGKSGKKCALLMKQARRFAPTIFLGIVWIAAQLAKNSGISESVANWIVLVCATISGFVVVAQRLPLQNVFGIIVTMFSGGAVLILIDHLFRFSTPQFFGIENSSMIFLLLIWITTLVNVRGALKFFLYRWCKMENYGLWLIALSGLAIVMFCANSQRSAGAFFITAMIASMTLVAAVPWFVEKKPSNVEPDFQPALFLGILVLQGLCGAN